MNTPTENAVKPFSAGIHNRAPRADFQYFGRGFTIGSSMAVPPILFYLPRQMTRRKVWFTWTMSQVSNINATSIDVKLVLNNVRNPSLNRVFQVQWITPEHNRNLRMSEGHSQAVPYSAVLVSQLENEVICFKGKVVQPLASFPDGYALTVGANHVIGEFDYVTLQNNTPNGTNAASTQIMFAAVYSEEIIETR